MKQAVKAKKETCTLIQLDLQRLVIVHNMNTIINYNQVSLLKSTTYINRYIWTHVHCTYN